MAEEGSPETMQEDMELYLLTFDFEMNSLRAGIEQVRFLQRELRGNNARIQTFLELTPLPEINMNFIFTRFPFRSTHFRNLFRTLFKTINHFLRSFRTQVQIVYVLPDTLHDRIHNATLDVVTASSAAVRQRLQTFDQEIEQLHTLLASTPTRELQNEYEEMRQNKVQFEQRKLEEFMVEVFRRVFQTRADLDLHHTDALRHRLSVPTARYCALWRQSKESITTKIRELAEVVRQYETARNEVIDEGFIDFSNEAIDWVNDADKIFEKVCHYMSLVDEVVREYLREEGVQSLHTWYDELSDDDDDI